MSKSVGIDLGTTNSVIAVLEGDEPKVVVSAEGGRTTPSVVAYPVDGDRLTGQVAKRQAVMNPERTISSAKRFVGRKWGEVDAEARQVPFAVTRGPSDAVRFDVGGTQIAPEEVSAQVLRKLVADAADYLGEPVNDVVITVPAYFNDSQRQATKDAGKIAGLNVLRIVNEPTAAALAYGLANSGKSQKVLVFDLGGGTFDVSLLDISDGVVEVLSTAGDTHLGGDDFDRVLVDHLAAEFKKDNGIDLKTDKQALQRLTEAAEKAKCELSSTPETKISLPFITADASGPRHLEAKLSRAKLEQLTEPLVARCKKPVLRSLDDAGLAPADVDEVLLVGGSTRIPAVKAMVKSLIGKEPNQSVNPDEVVALGAAVQAGVLAGDVKDMLLLDVTPLSLGIETLGGVMTKLIERNTTIPTRKTETFSTAEDNQPAVTVRVLQGEREMAGDNRLLAQFNLEGILPAPRGTPQVEVGFDIDANGILQVSAVDKATGKEQKVTVTASSNLSQSDIDKAVSDAEANAAEDQRRRGAVETRNKAEQLAFAAEQQLDSLSDSDALSASEAEEIKSLCERIHEAVEKEEDADTVESLRSELEQKLHKVAEAAYKQQAPTDGGAPGAPGCDSGCDSGCGSHTGSHPGANGANGSNGANGQPQWASSDGNKPGDGAIDAEYSEVK